MGTKKAWWQRIRDRNRTLRGLISARRRYAARLERLQGKQPSKRQYSVPAIARRIGAPLTYLKRIVRGQQQPPPALIAKLAKDLDIPVGELKVLFEGKAKTAGVQDPWQVLEENLISSVRTFVDLLRSCSGQRRELKGSRGTPPT